METAHTIRDIPVLQDLPLPGDNSDFARKVTEQRAHKQERINEKERLASQVNGLLASVEIAITKLQSQMAGHSSPALSNRMAEYQKIEQTAESVLLALREPGASISTLARVEAANQATLAEDDDKDTKVDGKDKEKLPVLWRSTPDPDEKDPSLFGQPLMSNLTRRSNQESAILDENTALSTQATSQASTGQKDLLATVALSALLYEGYQHRDTLEATEKKVEQFINEEKAKMRGAAGTDVSEAAINARGDAIREKAEDIHAGMLQGQQTGGERLIAAAEYFAVNPMREHMNTSAAHMGTATEHLEQRLKLKLGHHATEHLQDYNTNVQDWQKLKDKTLDQLETQLAAARANLKDMSLPDGSGKELYAALSSRINLDGITDNLSNYADANAALLDKQAAIFQHIHGKTQEHQQAVADLFTGKSDDTSVAGSLGMKERDLRLATMKYRVKSDQPVGGNMMDSFGKDMTAELNAGRGASLV